MQITRDSRNHEYSFWGGRGRGALGTRAGPLSPEQVL